MAREKSQVPGGGSGLSERDKLRRIREGIKNTIYDDAKEAKAKKLSKEDIKNKNYKGYPTIGIGHKLTDEEKETFKVYGIDISKPLSQEDIDYIEFRDVDKHDSLTDKNIEKHGIKNLSEKQINAIRDVGYQLGPNWLDKFKTTRKYIKEGKFDKAAKQAEKSLWFKQTPDRVKDFQNNLIPSYEQNSTSEPYVDPVQQLLREPSSIEESMQQQPEIESIVKAKIRQKRAGLPFDKQLEGADPIDLSRPSEEFNPTDRVDSVIAAAQQEAANSASISQSKQGEQIISQQPSKVKEIIKEVGNQQGVEQKDIDGALKNVDNISAGRDKASGDSLSSQFTNALTFFLPSIIGAIGGAVVEGSEGAVMGAETAQNLYGKYLDEEFRNKQLNIKNDPNKMTEFQRRSLELRKKEVEMDAEAEKRRNRGLDLNYDKFGLDKQKAAQLSDKQVERLQDITLVEKSLDRIEELRLEVDTGPLAGRIQSMAAWADLSPQSFNKMKVRTASTLSNYVKSISGAQVTEAEAARLQAVIPNVNDAPAVFEDKLNEFKKIIAENKEAFAEAIRTGQPLKEGSIKGLLRAETKFLGKNGGIIKSPSKNTLEKSVMSAEQQIQAMSPEKLKRYEEFKAKRRGGK